MSSGYIISTGAHYHWVKTIAASTTGRGALKLTLRGDPTAAEHQFNEAEITIFTNDVALTARLIKAINGAAAEPEVIRAVKQEAVT